MQSIQPRRARASIVAIGLIVAAVAYLDAQSSVAGQTALARGASPGRSSQAREAEAEIARTDLGRTIKNAMGSAFGGMWFEPSTAQLHVGVTSTASRETAEAVAASAGLAGIVTETPVRSTWAQLAAEQHRWNDRLADLFDRGEVKTSIAPDTNSVEVELGSGVSSSRRAALKGEASAGTVDVSVAATPYSDLRVERQARCKAFWPTEAYCDPTIVAGVSIENNKETGRCTAGPAVVLEKPTKAKPTRATETYLLTAGHCIEETGGINEKWSSFNKNSEKKEIGAAVDYRNKKTDAGVIKVNNPVINKSGYWAVKGLSPVTPAVALWEEAEPEPVTVLGESEPLKGTEACLSGQTTETQCGEIVKESTSVDWGTGVLNEELAEVTGPTTEKGDSGGPWFANGSPGHIEGTHVGRLKSGNVVFQPLPSIFKNLTYKFALLMESNENRHPVKIHAESAPAVLTGKQDGEKQTVFKGDAGTLSCAKATYSGELTETQEVEVTLTPSYSECKAFGLSATVDVNSCQYTFTTAAKEEANYEGSVDLICPEGKRLEITAVGCRITVEPQADLETITYTNNGSGSTREITIDFALSEIAYEEHNVAPFNSCASSTVPKSNGSDETAAVLTGETKEASQRGIWIE
jgi:Trypsin